MPSFFLFFLQGTIKLKKYLKILQDLPENRNEKYQYFNPDLIVIRREDGEIISN